MSKEKKKNITYCENRPINSLFNWLTKCAIRKEMFQQVRGFASSSLRAAFAKMSLMGTVGNVATKETREGVPYIRYSLAVNRYSPNASEERVTDWFNISVFNERHLNFFKDYLKPGMQLYVECDVRQRTIADENGENRRSLNSLRQTSYDVIRFAKRPEEQSQEEAN